MQYRNFFLLLTYKHKINAMENKIRLLVLKFKNQLEHNEIKYFRGAVIHSLQQNNILFHNHTDKGLRYAYPLIQYKRIRQCAAIVCMNQGAEAIGSFFSNYQNHLMIGNRPVTFEIDFLHPAEVTIGLTDTMQVYQLNRWLPLNTKNYHIYQSLEGLVERITFLEKILTANILACTKGLDIRLDQLLTCKIQDILQTYPVEHKGVKFMAFNIIFTANITLPDYLSIGKNASMDCGIVTHVPNQ